MAPARGGGKYKFQAALLIQSLGTNDFERQYCGLSNRGWGTSSSRQPGAYR
jgi:hypothetical protein